MGPRPAVIEDPDLHAHIRGIPFQWRTDADPVVGVLGQPEFEAEAEIRVLLRGKEISAVLFGGEEDAAFNLISLAGSVLGYRWRAAVHPPGESLSLKSRVNPS